MHRVLTVASLAALALFASVQTASAQSVTFNFEDSTDQGFGSGFGTDADRNFQLVTNGAPGNGTTYIRVPVGGFQVAAHNANSAALVAAANAAAGSPTQYVLSYDWYIDTSLYAANPGTFLQIGSYVNSGAGYYSQNFGATKEAELNGTQLASGQVFSGHVETLFSVYSPDGGSNNLGPITTQTANTFWRVGLILNGTGGTQVAVDFDNVSIHPIPEPATLGLLGLALPALAIRRRRA